jgi:CDP-6-deoxy-D-xylo-4-hexulose-3-dehydrase
MKKFNWPLMSNNILKSDKKKLINFIQSSNKFTNGHKVKEFETKWSDWLGVKYSTFVNSGASANLITLHILKEINKNKNKNEIILPAFTWSSDIVSVINAGFRPVFVDINFKNLAINEEMVKKKINRNTLAIFLTHAMGFVGISKKFINYIKSKKIFLIEDVCESHGAKIGFKKAGTFGIISNFSFYYGHHMTTIEGGMISTDSKKIDRLAKMKRGHGLLRDSQDKKYIKKNLIKYKDLNNDFIFNTSGFNMRNTEIAAVLGIEQLKRLNKNIKTRNYNHDIFLNNLRDDIFFKNFSLVGSSNYGFHLILKKRDKILFIKVLKILRKNLIEFRLGSLGNQLRQPYLRNFQTKEAMNRLKNTDHMHFYSVYIGNNQFLKKDKIINLCKNLDNL